MCQNFARLYWEIISLFKEMSAQADELVLLNLNTYLKNWECTSGVTSSPKTYSPRKNMDNILMVISAYSLHL